MKLISRMLFAGFAVMLANSAQAAEHATPEQAQALLDKAVAELKMDGPEKAFAAFNDRKGGYKIAELYVFVFDMDGKYMASGANPGLVGTDAHDLKDAKGTPVVQEMIDLAKSKGKGQVDYFWLNRVENKDETKHSLIQRSGSYIVGVGYYQN